MALMAPKIEGRIVWPSTGRRRIHTWGHCNGWRHTISYATWSGICEGDPLVKVGEILSFREPRWIQRFVERCIMDRLDIHEIEDLVVSSITGQDIIMPLIRYTINNCQNSVCRVNSDLTAFGRERVR